MRHGEDVLLGLIVLSPIYLLPAIISSIKGTRHAFGVWFTNIFFGWIPFIWLLLFMCVLFYWPTKEQYKAELENEQLDIDAKRAILAMEERSRNAINYR